MPVTSILPRAAVAVLLALGIVFAKSGGRQFAATKRGLMLLTGTRTRSPLQRAIALARAQHVLNVRLLPDGRAAYVLTKRGVAALADLGVAP